MAHDMKTKTKNHAERLLAPEEFAMRVNRSVRTVRRWAAGRRPERFGAVVLCGRLAGFHWPTFLARCLNEENRK
jgi:hypothetical protein